MPNNGLAPVLVALGVYENITRANAAIDNGRVYKDGNGQIRAAGWSGIIDPNGKNISAPDLAALPTKHNRPQDKDKAD